MPSSVKGSGLRAAQVAQTEERIVGSARALFLAQGYAATTLTQVAERAGVSARTVYVRFGSKSTLLRRVIDVALVGDAAPVDVAHRPLFERAMDAASLAQRLEALLEGSIGIMRRAGALFAVADQAEATEPDVATAAQAGREATRDLIERFWRKAEEDDLLAPGADPTWLAQIMAVLCAADTFVHVVRTFGWDLADYEAWLRESVGNLTAPQPTE